MRCFTVLGPAGAGKTALLDRLARLEGPGQRVEMRGGLAAATFSFMGDAWCAIDCPGDIEVLPDGRAALLASDAALLAVPPDPGAAVLAAPFLRVAEAAGTPCLIFINRIDETRGPLRDIVAALQEYSEHPIVLRQVPIREEGRIVGAVDLVSERAWRYREGGPSTLIEVPEGVIAREQEARAEMLEHLSEFDDWLLEEIIEDREPAAGPLYAICSRVLGENRLTPALIGSALHGAGVVRLMKALRHETPQPDVLRARLSEDPAAEGTVPRAVAFHARHRRHLGKAVFLRALDEGVAVGTQLGGGGIGTLMEIGGEKKVEGALPAGGVAMALKSDHLAAPRLLMADRSCDPPAWARSPAPMFTRRLACESDRDEAKLSLALARLAEDDPGCVAAQEETTGSPLLHIQGPVHLRRILSTLADEFGVKAADTAPDGIWRETITKPVNVHHRHKKQTGGAGQFADVKISVRPNPRGAGFTFEETVKGGSVPRNYIPSVEAGARDALSRGPLGFPVIDIAVTLTDGQHHSVDSSDFAFRAAGHAAVTQALSEGTPTLLQPIHEVTIHAPSVHSGALVAMIGTLKGRVLGFDRDPEGRGWDVFRAHLPVGALEDLAQALRSATQGVGWFESTFDHLEEVYGRDADRVVAARRAGA